MKYLSGFFGPSHSIANEGNWLVRAFGGAPTHAGARVSEFTALNLTVVYRAISLISDSIGMLPCQLYRRTDKGQVEAREHPTYRAIYSAPNEQMTSFTWRQTQQQHALLWGNGYAAIERNGRGQAIGQIPLLPDRTRLDKPLGKEARYVTTVDGKPMEIHPDDVVHIPALGFDGLQGYSPIYMARQAIGLGLAMEEFGGKFFKNDAKSGGFIHYPGQLGDAGRKNLQDSLQKQGGLDGAHRVKILEEGAKFVQTTIPPEDAQFLGTREFQIAEVARLYGVPLHMLQSHEKSTSWGSGLEEMTSAFIIFTLGPWLTRWEQELERKLLLPSEQEEYFIKFNVNALMRGTAQSRAEFYAKALGGKPWMEVDEVREKEDLNRLDTPQGTGEFHEPTTPPPDGEANEGEDDAV